VADGTGTGSGAGTTLEEPRASSSIERIRRLEILECERLEEKARRDLHRREVVEGARPTGGRHDRVDAIERVTRYPLFLLGIAWLVIAVIVLTTDVDSSASTTLVAVLFALWAVMLVEYLVRLVISPDRRGYLRRRWVEPATVVLPPLQGWHLVGMEKMSLLVHEGELRAEAILKHHSLFRVLIAALGTLLVGSWLVLLFEEHAPGSNIHNYPDALWWAIVTVTTVGYGDRFPVTGGGRAVAVVLMLVGIGLIGTLTATVASVFMKEHTDANKALLQKSHADLGHQLSVISERLADVERRLGASPDQLAAIDTAAEAEADAAGPTPPDPDPGASTA
jgi:voltage-gated potassium channel